MTAPANLARLKGQLCCDAKAAGKSVGLLMARVLDRHLLEATCEYASVRPNDMPR